MENEIAHTERAHARLAPSSAKAWMNCAGRVNYTKDMPDDTSPAAELGTAAHEAAEKALRKWTMADNQLGDIINDHEMTDDIIDAVNQYLGIIYMSVSKKDVEEKKVIIGIEKRFSIPEIDKDIFGTNDFFAYFVESKKLVVNDYKNGVGVVVPARDNPQLKIYALGAAKMLWEMQSEKTKKHFKPENLIEDVELIITQPRAKYGDKIKTHSMKYQELLDWVPELQKAAIATRQPNAPLNAGPWCKSSFCKAIAMCPAYRKQIVSVFKDPLPPEVMTPDQLTRALSLADRVETWIKSVKKYAFVQLNNGVKIEGKKLIAGRATRCWKNEKNAEITLVQLLGEGAHEKKMLSVAKAETALVKKKLMSKKDLQGLYFKKPGGPKMVDSTDPGKEYKQLILDEFKNKPVIKEGMFG